MFNQKRKIMKKFTTFFGTLCLVLITVTSVFAQVPADQQVIVVEPGVATLETAINDDVDENGNRVNPNRIYQLKKDGIYIMSSRIQFGEEGRPDSTATLTIEGELGGKLPVVLMQPKDGGDAFRSIIHGSLTVKNLFWQAEALNGTASGVFGLERSNQRLIVDNCVFESGRQGDLIDLTAVKGTMDIYIKNSYFRDNTQFANPWNFAVINRGTNGEAIDTMWIENTTVGNAGLTFFGKLNPINFLFFNHNTIVNIPKYVFFYEQYKEAYFTNNMFINCNWQGEEIQMSLSQLQSQIEDGPRFMGITNLMEPDDNLWELGHGQTHDIEDVKWFSSNNLHFTSPYLNKYYNGEYNTVADHPISNIDWGFAPPGTTYPQPVENIPAAFMSDLTKELMAAHEGIKADTNFIQVDPMMVTKGIADQTEADEYAKWARNNYGVANDGETFSSETMSFGDQDPTTIPGIGTENGDGFTNVTDLVEDFSYTADLKSMIDMRSLGSLAWFPEQLAGYDGAAALAEVKSYYDNVGTPPQNAETTVWNPAANPSSTGLWSEAANWTDGVVPNANKVVFNVPDAQECVMNVTGSINKLVTGDGANGGTLKVTEGGTLTTGATWSGIGWTHEAKLVVETGGTVNFGEHMWVGWEPGSKGIVEINGGTINVAGMFGMNFEDKGGIGEVHVNSGMLNLANIQYPNSIRDGSVLDISEGSVVIAGEDKENVILNFIAADKITAFGGTGTVSITVGNGSTTLTAMTTGINDVDESHLSKVYPNPTDGVLYITNPSRGSFGFEIVAITGKVVKKEAGIRDNIAQVNMLDLPQGIYIVNVVSENVTVRHKVIFK